MSKNVPSLVRATKESLESSMQLPAKFDADLYHVMDQRDNALIADEVLHGAMSGAFVYNFSVSGKDVTGVSVRGAKHLANYYGGLQHRIVASTSKKGVLFTHKSYPAENMPMAVSCARVPELENDPDYYEVVIEIKDIKTGNTVQATKSEMRKEARRDGSLYDRPNYSTIAESKAYRNAILTLIPQDVIIEFQNQCLKLGKNADLTANALQEKRNAVLKFATAKAVTLDRDTVNNLAWDDISGLSDSAREGIEAFKAAADAKGLTGNVIEAKVEKPKAMRTAKKEATPAAPPAQIEPRAEVKSEERPHTVDEEGEITFDD